MVADWYLGRSADRSPWLGHPRFAISTLAWSVPVWLVFELANFRMANWYYVMANPDLGIRRLGTVLAFGTVLPAIFLAYRAVSRHRPGESWRTPPMGWLTAHPRTLQCIGFGFAGLALWRPATFFPLIWGSVTLILEPFNLARDPRTSLIADLAEGRPGRLVRLLLAGAAVGLTWELLNSIALTRWIYTVPGLESLKLFEMPMLGYLGFPVFALDCFVVYHSLVHLGVAIPGWEAPDPVPSAAGRARVRPVPSGSGARLRMLLAVSAAALFSSGVMWGMDRWTVDSYHAPLVDLAEVAPGAPEPLTAAGFGSVAAVAAARSSDLVGVGITPEAAERWLGWAGLTLLRGMGAENAAALEAAGIGSICMLAYAEPERVRDAIRARRADPHAGSAARIRVWQVAAVRACGPERRTVESND